MKKCPHCGMTAGTEQLFCENCGHRMEEAAEDTKKTGKAKNQGNRSLDGQSEECLKQNEEIVKKLQQELEQKTQEAKRFKKKKRKWMLSSLVLLLAFGCTAAFGIMQTNELDFAERRISNLIDDRDELEEQLEALNKMSEFVNERVVFIGEDMEYYHRFDCELWWDGPFLAFNTNAAKSRGYVPCSECMGDVIDES